ncbi:hypothetical protein CMI47_15135 [Candidatus Pacearchaeota archaeon]|jgi:hypothetical protein|nr:hypothetical protein [Candidatus Pacearchaeota archaeon]|tara:strand:- start:376 stop:585 length:210 start_codon:yes stop_codon:yes gene_type:complete
MSSNPGEKTPNQLWRFEVVSVVDNPDGTAMLNIDVDDDFIEWFKEWQGLKRWSQKRFQKVMIEALTKEL